MMLFLLKYWRLIAIFLVIVVVVVGVEFLDNKIETLTKDNEVLQSKVSKDEALLAVQNALILQNKSDYDVAVKKLPTIIKTIDTRYKTVYKNIETFKEGDRNESNDCNDSIAYLNTFNY